MLLDGKGGSVIGYGASVYNSSFVLSHFLATHYKDSIKNKRVIEIGCGTGLCSITVALTCHPLYLVATDGDTDLLELTKRNMERNKVSMMIPTYNTSEASSLLTKPMVSVDRLLWGDKKDFSELTSKLQYYCTNGDNDHTGRSAAGALLDGEEKIKKQEAYFDFLICSDVVAFPYEEHYNNLIQDFVQLSTTASTIIIAYQQRSITEKKFFNRCSKFFHVTKVERELLHPDFISPHHNLPMLPIELFILCKIKDE
jgi:predicted nicotinamide N-methyase